MSRIGRVMTVAGLSASVAGCSFGINEAGEVTATPATPESLCVPVETTINSFGVLTTQRKTETLEEYYSRLAEELGESLRSENEDLVMSIGRFAACDTSSNPEIFDIEMIRDDPDYINPLIQVEGEVSNGSSIIADCIISDFITEYNVFTALKDDQGRQIVAVICVDGEITELN